MEGKEAPGKEKDKNSNAGDIKKIKKIIKFPLKIKLIAIGILLSFFILIIYLVIFTVLVDQGFLDIDDNSAYAMGNPYYANSNSYWWPIGSTETTTENGILFAKGEPENTVVTSEYGDSEDRNHSHKGLDIANYTGNNVTNIIASKSGEVIYPTSEAQTKYDSNGCINCERSSDGGGYGNYVMIKHSDGNYTIYAHMAQDSITVRAGDTVSQGQVIGKMGSSGNSTGTHLHFEMRIGSDSSDATENPRNYVDEENTRPLSYGGGSSFSLVSTTLSKSEFNVKMTDYCSRSGNSSFCKNFANNADTIYSKSISSGVNPELVVVTAGTEQGWQNPSGSYNYWGIGVGNGSNDVGNFGSLESGIAAYAETLKAYSDTNSSFYNQIVNRYNDRESAGCSPSGHGLPGTLEGMQSVYSWVGTYRFNPGSSGLGGCYYLDRIYGSGYCSKVRTCSNYSNCPNSSRTTTCEQNDYTAYQLEGKLSLRYDIFGL